MGSEPSTPQATSRHDRCTGMWRTVGRLEAVADSSSRRQRGKFQTGPACGCPITGRRTRVNFGGAADYIRGFPQTSADSTQPPTGHRVTNGHTAHGRDRTARPPISIVKRMLASEENWEARSTTATSVSLSSVRDCRIERMPSCPSAYRACLRKSVSFVMRIKRCCCASAKISGSSARPVNPTSASWSTAAKPASSSRRNAAVVDSSIQEKAPLTRHYGPRA